MNDPLDRLAVFPGAFDPPTLGHLDVIERGARLFGRLIVAVGPNPDKRSLLSPESRVALLRQCTSHLPNVSVDLYAGLTGDFARRAGAGTLLRGLRCGDLVHELQMAMTHRAVANLETVFIPASAEFSFISSTLVRQVASMGGDVSRLVPEPVRDYLRRPATEGLKPDEGNRLAR